MIVGIPQRGQGQRVPRGRDPRGRARADLARATRSSSRRRRGGLRAPRRAVRSPPARESLPNADEVFDAADMIVKVKEPQPAGVRPVPRRTRSCSRTCTWPPTEALTRVPARAQGRGASPTRPSQLADGRLPLLAPMSEIAGRMAPQVGAYFLEKPYGGRGMLMGGASGVAPAQRGRARGGDGGAERRLDRRRDGGRGDGARSRTLDRLRFVDQIQQGTDPDADEQRLALEQLVREADLVIGAVLVPGARAPQSGDRGDGARRCVPGSVIVDISIDQGGCVETAHMTTHSDPTYVEHGVVHYCVGNMPGAVPSTSTYALTNVTLPYALEIATHGLERAVREDPALALGVNALRRCRSRTPGGGGARPALRAARGRGRGQGRDRSRERTAGARRRSDGRSQRFLDHLARGAGLVRAHTSWRTGAI